MLKFKTKENDERDDFEILGKRFKIYFIEKYAVIQLIGDILVGLFFVTGSVLNLAGAPAVYGNVAYLIGSLSLTIRPIIKVIRKTWIYKDHEK